MADTEFGQYKRSYLVGDEQNLYEQKLLAKLQRGRTGDPLGKIRELLAPADTSAYPPSVLGMQVNREDYFPPGTLGDYSQKNNIIRLLSNLYYNSTYSPYKALLHEAGHARGFSQAKGLPSYELLKKLISEGYAEDLADSLYIGERGYRGNREDQ